MVVINLWGAPGSGKSTAAANLFSRLKSIGVNAELVTEFAKDLTWEDRECAIKNQLYVSGNQAFRVSRLEGKVDVVITDSPIPSGLLYLSAEKKELFRPVLYDEYFKYDNVNFLMIRVTPYDNNGRGQTENESDKIGNELISEVTIFLPCPIYRISNNQEGLNYLFLTVKEMLVEKGIVNETKD